MFETATLPPVICLSDLHPPKRRPGQPISAGKWRETALKTFIVLFFFPPPECPWVSKDGQALIHYNPLSVYALIAAG